MITNWKGQKNRSLLDLKVAGLQKILFREK